ncbi:phenylacetate--CoA ligase family protein [Thiolapillus sp.]
MYSQVYRKILEPLWEEKIRKRHTLEYERKLNESQWLPEDDIRSIQWQELRKLLIHSEKECPYWRNAFEEAGLQARDIVSYDQFRSLPLTTKPIIREHYDDLIARSYRGKTWKKSTGGSTGAPLQFEYTPESDQWRQAVTRRGYAWAGAIGGIKQVYIWGVSLGKEPLIQKLKQNLHHLILRHRYFNSFSCNQESMRHWQRDIEKYDPKVIVGYTNPLYTFAKFINDRASAALIHPDSIITAAENLFDYQRVEIEKAFHAPVFHSYGSREFMLIAMECEKHEGLHISAENLFVEILREDGTPADPGEEGRVVVTDLHNYGMPFIRYDIGDLAVWSDKPCSCGRGLPMLKKISGRVLDIIRTPNGKSIPGEFFPHLLKDFSEILQFQIIQKKLDKLTVKLVTANGIGEESLDKIKKHISEAMGENCTIEYEFVDEIPLTKTGKHRVTMSMLSR